MTRKAKILARVKTYLKMNDLSAMRWWVTPNHALNCLTPDQFSKKEDGYKRLEELVGFSESRLDDFCTKDTGPCAWCDVQKAKHKSAWDKIFRRNGTVATRSNDRTVATSEKLMTPQPTTSGGSTKNPS